MARRGRSRLRRTPRTRRLLHGTSPWCDPGSLEVGIATRIGTAAGDLHEEDVHAWALEQAALLRAGRLEALDLAHLIEQVEELAGALRGAARRRARIIMEHFPRLERLP